MGEAEAKPAKSKNFHLDLPCQSSVTAVEWMPDGQKFLTAGQDGLVKVSSPHCARNGLPCRSWDVSRFSGTLPDAAGRYGCGTRGVARCMSQLYMEPEGGN